MNLTLNQVREMKEHAEVKMEYYQEEEGNQEYIEYTIQLADMLIPILEKQEGYVFNSENFIRN